MLNVRSVECPICSVFDFSFLFSIFQLYTAISAFQLLKRGFQRFPLSAFPEGQKVPKLGTDPFSERGSVVATIEIVSWQE